MSTKYKGLDIKGQKFSKLTVVKHLVDRSHHQADYWECLCDCGGSVVLLTRQLIRGQVKSCGCLLRESAGLMGAKNKKHGLRNTRQYYIWRGMKARCSNTKNPNYDGYGGRGIAYDPKWETFEGFWEDMSEGYSDDLELDRIDPNGNYCKENCRWVDSYMSAINKNTPVNNTSGITGVHFDTKTNKWMARISVKGVRKHLGNFDTLEEAVTARKQAELDYFNENFGNQWC